MNASEKLKALYAKHLEEDEWGNRTAEPITYPASYALAAALPQIVAVVEAAENPNALRGDLDRALAALNEALS